MKKYFFSYLIIFLFFFILIYVSVNSNLRRNILSLSLGFINNYYSITIQQNLSSETNLVNAIKKIEQQIKVTDFITTKSKNSFIDNIYLNAYKIERFINSEKDFKYFSKVIKKLIEKDPDIYDALVWDAKLMSYNNLGKKKILSRIDAAIELSPASQTAYKFALDYSKKISDEKLFNKYCKKYHTSLLGGNIEKGNISLFSGSSLTRFAVQINSQKEEIYLMEGINLNEDQDYIFDLKQPLNFENFEILSNFLPGILINFLSLEFTDINNEKFVVPIKDIYLSSNNSFFVESQNIAKILTTSFDDEKVKVRLPKVYKNISQLKLRINFSKANLTNKLKC